MKHLYSVTLLFLFLSSQCHANKHSLEKLQTLFTSPETRHKLNALRSKRTHSTPIVRTHQKPDHFTFQGIVIRNNKPPIIFLNDKFSSASKKLSLNNYVLKISVNNKIIYLKPGQKSHGDFIQNNNAPIQTKLKN